MAIQPHSGAKSTPIYTFDMSYFQIIVSILTHAQQFSKNKIRET